MTSPISHHQDDQRDESAESKRYDRDDFLQGMLASPSRTRL